MRNQQQQQAGTSTHFTQPTIWKDLGMWNLAFVCLKNHVHRATASVGTTFLMIKSYREVQLHVLRIPSFLRRSSVQGVILPQTKSVEPSLYTAAAVCITIIPNSSLTSLIWYVSRPRVPLHLVGHQNVCVPGYTFISLSTARPPCDGVSHSVNI